MHVMPWQLWKSRRCLRATGCDAGMISKIVLLFLAFIAILAMFGKLATAGRWLGVTKKCRACGRHKIGKGPCPCGKGRHT